MTRTNSNVSSPHRLRLINSQRDPGATRMGRKGRREEPPLRGHTEPPNAGQACGLPAGLRVPELTSADLASWSPDYKPRQGFPSAREKPPLPLRARARHGGSRESAAAPARSTSPRPPARSPRRKHACPRPLQKALVLPASGGGGSGGFPADATLVSVRPAAGGGRILMCLILADSPKRVLDIHLHKE